MGTYYRRIILICLFLLVPLKVQAEVLVQYNFTASSLDTTTNATGIAGGTMADGGSLTAFVVNTSFSYSTSPVLRTNPASGTTNASTAVSTNSYFEFSVTPTNLEMDLTSLTFKAARGGSATPRGWVLRSSIDSYGENISTDTLTTQRTTFRDYTVDLSGANFQNLTSAITFRLYIYTQSTSLSVEWDNITVNGTTTSIGSGLTSDTFEDSIPTITRYIELERSGTTLTAKIYSDNQFSTLLDTLTVTTTTTTHRYLYAGISYNSGVSGTTFSGEIKSLDIEAGSGNPPPPPPAAIGATTSITITGQNLSISFP